LPLQKHFGTILSMSPSNAAVASSPKLLDRVRWHLRVKHYSIRTEQAYLDWIRRYILFHHKRHPNEMGEREITEFLTHLAVDKHVAASTQNQAFAALLFLYQKVLDRNLDFIDNVERVKRPAKTSRRLHASRSTRRSGALEGRLPSYGRIAFPAVGCA
jgi:site-specific recombinase XerD